MDKLINALLLKGFSILLKTLDVQSVEVTVKFLNKNNEIVLTESKNFTVEQLEKLMQEE